MLHCVYQPYGPINPVTGRRGIFAILIGSPVQEYHPARAVPDTLAEQATPARELMDSRGTENEPDDLQND